MRDVLVPINKKWNIATLLDALREYPGLSNSERITFEYVMLDGVNDTKEDAHRLVKLLEGIPAKVNLIPFNEWPGAPYKRSSGNRIHAFADIIYQAGYASPIRTPRGEDIMAACGQLKSATERARKSAREIAAEAGRSGRFSRVGACGGRTGRSRPPGPAGHSSPEAIWTTGELGTVRRRPSLASIGRAGGVFRSPAIEHRKQQRVGEDRDQRAGDDQILRLGRDDGEVDAHHDQDEGKFADLRQAGGDGQGGAFFMAEGADDAIGGDGFDQRG